VNYFKDDSASKGRYLCRYLNFNPKRGPTYCFVRLSDAVFACGPISTLRDVMSAVPVKDVPETVP
jgi:hypothetical protein